MAGALVFDAEGCAKFESRSGTNSIKYRGGGHLLIAASAAGAEAARRRLKAGVELELGHGQGRAVRAILLVAAAQDASGDDARAGKSGERSTDGKTNKKRRKRARQAEARAEARAGGTDGDARRRRRQQGSRRRRRRRRRRGAA